MRPPEPPKDFTTLVQWHTDEVEFLFASIGERTDYAGHAAHLQAQLDRGDASALVPCDLALWQAVVAELHRRDAGVITPDNAAWFAGVEG